MSSLGCGRKKVLSAWPDKRDPDVRVSQRVGVRGLGPQGATEPGTVLWRSTLAVKLGGHLHSSQFKTTDTDPQTDMRQK